MTSHSRHDVSVLFLAGEIDIATKPGIEQELLRAGCDAASGIVVDLADVTFMDSAGIHLLLDAQRRASDRGHSFRVQRASSQTERLFDLAQATALTRTA